MGGRKSEAETVRTAGTVGTAETVGTAGCPFPGGLDQTPQTLKAAAARAGPGPRDPQGGAGTSGVRLKSQHWVCWKHIAAFSGASASLVL